MRGRTYFRLIESLIFRQVHKLSREINFAENVEKKKRYFTVNICFESSTFVLCNAYIVGMINA